MSIFSSISLEMVISIISAILAIYATYISRRSASHTRLIDAVTTLYEEFNTLGLLRCDNWELSHLLEMPNNYLSAKQQIQLSLGKLSAEKKAEMLIRERAIANRVFSLFEQVHYYKQQAIKEKLNDRVVFLNEVLNYFTERLLVNPRLRYLWDPDGGNLEEYFEELVKKLHREKITSIFHIEAGDEPGMYDPVGPYL